MRGISGAQQDAEEEDVVEERQVDGVAVFGGHIPHLPFRRIRMRATW